MLINCVVYQQGRKIRDIPVKEIAWHLSQPDDFVWVALRDPQPVELDEIRSAFNLHELAFADARRAHQRPHIEEYGDAVFVVMKLVEIVEGALTVGELAIFAGKNYVLSVRSRSQQHFFGIRERCEREPHLLRQGSGFVLYALMDAVVDRYFPLVDALELELETVEEQMFVKGSARSNIERLYEVKRKVNLLKNAVAPLLDAVTNLYGQRTPAVCANTQEYFHDVYDHLAYINASIDGIRETISTAIQVNLSMVAIDQSEVSKQLAAWAGIFAIATALVGIWGMNFEFMPELKWQYGYPFALFLIALVCGVLFLRFKRLGWL